VKRWMLAALASAVVAFALAAPAGANPQGGPFQEPFPVTCAGLGEVMVVEAPGQTANSWTTSGLHVVFVSLEATFTDDRPSPDIQQVLWRTRGDDDSVLVCGNVRGRDGDDGRQRRRRPDPAALIRREEGRVPSFP
jgi:hypothetical protein